MQESKQPPVIIAGKAIPFLTTDALVEMARRDLGIISIEGQIVRSGTDFVGVDIFVKDQLGSRTVRVTNDEIETVRNRSAWKNKGPWVSHFERMASLTAIRIYLGARFNPSAQVVFSSPDRGYVAVQEESWTTVASRLKDVAQSARTPQEIWGMAHDLGGIYQEDGDETHDSYWFAEDNSVATVNRDTLEIEATANPL
jgi:hypothetical protein